jgi:FtsP/CotA-like multicopper oxidase with cupredoxin domain
MHKRKWLPLIGLGLAVFFMVFGFDLSRAQTMPAKRPEMSQKMPQMRSVTAAQRKAAALRAQAARAEFLAKSGLAAAAAPITAAAVPGGTPDYFGLNPNYANSPTNLRKFVDRLPGLGSANANSAGQYIPIATPFAAPPAGVPADADYYEIGLTQYAVQMHPDLPPTTLRGYKDLNPAGDGANRYLGPLILAQRNRPVRIKFTNMLVPNSPLFLPVDTTVMGAGNGPDGTPYSVNRATLHLHGGNTPWISDGTPHQWTVPAGETTAHLKGVSTQNVPDMPAPGDGQMTFYYSNQQSGRLLFYHDHAYGITRLNVYAGEAAGYLITDPAEDALIYNGTTGVIPDNGGGVYTYGIPLVIQDKTFVDATTIANQDPTWNWGTTPPTPTTGDLWWPHVYMPNQNPYDLSGTAAMGRWDYGPWFWPIFVPQNGEVANPYYVPGGAEPPMIPGTPNPSIVPEAFMDTPIVNGAAYPYLEVEPKAYRFRVLNACNDRFLNLQLYVADPAVTTSDGRTDTEVKMIPAVAGPAIPAYWPTMDGRDGGVPDPTTAGPHIFQIGNESGFLPSVVDLPNTPIGYNYNRRDIVVLNVQEKTLFLGPAERADIVIDFSAFPGATILLYNDAPAPVPAFDPRNDYYTGNADQTATGGAPATVAGFGPNTRTIMQFRVAASTADPFVFSLPALQAALPPAFAASQNVPIVPETAFSGAYPSWLQDNYVRIQDTQFSFAPDPLTPPTTVPLQPKAIQELFELDFGRMNATLGVERPNTNATIQTTIPFGYLDPPTEIFQDGETQIWKFTHNGVDTHAIHFHLFDVELINRVGWDGAIRPPEPNEVGWKETVRMNPLEDAIVALRPKKQLNLPWSLPNSFRPLDVTSPLGSTTGFFGVDPNGNPVTVTNHLVNFGWEYVVHCHLLGHEENDMMRASVFAVAPEAPSGLTAAIVGTGRNTGVLLAWTDNSANETGFTIDRAADAAFATGITSISLGPNVTTYTDPGINRNLTYFYRVYATNTVGDIGTAGFPVTTAASGFSPAVMVGVDPTPLAPTNLSALEQAGPAVLLTWTDNATNETGFAVERSDNGGPFVQIATPGPRNNTGSVTYTDTAVVAGASYSYQVRAVNATVFSTYSNVASITLSVPPAAPAAPSNVLATGVVVSNNRSRINLAWTDNATNETGFEIQMATDAAFTQGLINATVGANVTTYQSGNLRRGLAYYIRIRAVNGPSPSAWINATPFPFTTL